MNYETIIIEQGTSTTIYEDEIKPVAIRLTYAIINKPEYQIPCFYSQSFSRQGGTPPGSRYVQAVQSSFKKTQSITSCPGVVEFSPAITFYWQYGFTTGGITVPVSGSPGMEYNLVCVPAIPATLDLTSRITSSIYNLFKKHQPFGEQGNGCLIPFNVIYFSEGMVFGAGTSTVNDLTVASGWLYSKAPVLCRRVAFLIFLIRRASRLVLTSIVLWAVPCLCQFKRWNFEWSHRSVPKRKK